MLSTRLTVLWVFFYCNYLWLYVVAFRSSLCLKMCWRLQSPVWPVFALVVFVHVFPHVRRVVRWCRWVCLVRMYPASIFQLFLWAAGLSSTLQAQMAFDNGLNRQMPGRHLAIDHSSERCVHFPCSPPGEQYLKPADWPPPGPRSCNPFILLLITIIAAFSDCVDVFQKCRSPL